MQIGAWYKFLNQKDENVNPPVKNTVADPVKLFHQVEKLTSQKPLENFSEESKILSIGNSEKFSNKSETRQMTKGT